MLWTGLIVPDVEVTPLWVVGRLRIIGRSCIGGVAWIVGMIDRPRVVVGIARVPRIVTPIDRIPRIVTAIDGLTWVPPATPIMDIRHQAIRLGGE